MNTISTQAVAVERADAFIKAAHLSEYGMSESALRMARELLVGLHMQAWHEGAIEGLNSIIRKMEPSKR